MWGQMDGWICLYLLTSVLAQEQLIIPIALPNLHRVAKPAKPTYYQSGGLDADPTPVAAGKRTLVSEY